MDWRINIMGTEEWLQEIFKLITENKPENMELLLIKWGGIAGELGYEVSFEE